MSFIRQFKACWNSNGTLENATFCSETSKNMIHSVQFTSASQSCLTLCNPMDCNTPGFLVYQQLPGLAQTHVHRVSNANHLILCRSLLPLPSIFPSIRVFSNESVLHIRWPEYWSFSFSIRPFNGYSGLISFRMDRLDLLAVQRTASVFFNTTVQKDQFSGAQLSLWSNSHIRT